MCSSAVAFEFVFFLIYLRLEYKYTKLIESTGGRDGELPGVDTCALDDGEEDEFDAVDFKKKARFFGKFSPYPRRGKVGLSVEVWKLMQ